MKGRVEESKTGELLKKKWTCKDLEKEGRKDIGKCGMKKSVRKEGMKEAQKEGGQQKNNKRWKGKEIETKLN